MAAISPEVKTRLEFKMKCATSEDLVFWLTSFEPSNPEEYTLNGTSRAFCSDCTSDHKATMQKRGLCLYDS